MLQTIRENSQGIIAKGIVGLIVITFALWGVQSLVSLTQRQKAPAEVNGVDITNQELQQGMELQRRQILAQMGNKADPSAIDEKLLRKSVMDQLVQRAVLLQSAKERGFHLSKDMIDQLIVSTPQFQVKGQFDKARFEAVLRGAGFTPLTYRDLLSKEKLIDQERAGYLLSAFATGPELEHLISLDRQTRDLAYTSIKPDTQAVKVSDSELQDLYKRKQATLMTDETVSVNYVLLDKAAMAKAQSVSDEEIQSAYQQMVASFKSTEERDARHILIDVTPKRDAAAALKKAQELRKEIMAGADFATVAKKESGDIGSAKKGGELGYNGRGVFVGPFEKALFSMKVGEVSQPIRTQFGYHLIKLEGIRSTKPPALAEVKSELHDQVAQNKAEKAYVAALGRLADLSFSSNDLSAVSDELKLKIQTSKPFGRQGGQGPISSSKKVVDAAFSDQVLNQKLNSDPIELDSGRTVVIHLNKHAEPRQLAFDEVRSKLEQQLRDQKARAVAAKQAQQWLTDLKQGKALKDIDANASWTEAKDVKRSDSKVPVTVLREAFAMPRPAKDKVSYALVEQAGGTQTLIALHGVSPGDTKLTDKERSSLESMLANQRGQAEYQAHIKALKDSADITYN